MKHFLKFLLISMAPVYMQITHASLVSESEEVKKDNQICLYKGKGQSQALKLLPELNPLPRGGTAVRYVIHHPNGNTTEHVLIGTIHTISSGHLGHRLWDAFCDEPGRAFFSEIGSGASFFDRKFSIGEHLSGLVKQHHVPLVQQGSLLSEENMNVFRDSILYKFYKNNCREIDQDCCNIHVLNIEK